MSSDEKVKILLVDDRRENLVALESVLESLGQTLVTAGSGREALKRLLDDEFAVILLDVQMPGMDGFETATVIRSREKSRTTPIIFLTAINKGDTYVSRGYSVGAVDYVFKPIDPDILNAKVSAFVDLWKRKHELQAEIAHRRATEERLDASNALLETMSRSLVEFIADSNPSFTLHRLLSSVLSLTRSEYGFIGEIVHTAEGEPCLRSHAVTMIAGSEKPAGRDKNPAAVLPLKTLWSDQLVGGRPFIAHSAATVPRRSELPAGHPLLRNLLALPFFKGPELSGLLAIANRSEGFSEEVAEFLKPVLNTCAIIIDASRNQERRQQAEEEVRRLNKDLERRVQERTVELQAANDELQVEIAERKQLQIELQQRAEALAEADRRKDEFLAMLAHELRNPLAPIINGLAVLEECAPDDAMLQRQCDVISRQARHLSRLVDDLLDVARITRNKIELRMAPLELAPLVTQAIEAARPFIEARGHELGVVLPPEPVWVEADAVRLQQVFSNLLNNAAKYTDPGGRIWLTVSVEGADAVILVQDTGIGIPGEMLPSVFDLFMQVDHSLDRSQGGLGIGLTMVEQLVRMHGGSVEARSEGRGLGSEFVVRVPTLEAAPGMAEPAPVRAPRERSAHGLAHLRVLLVEDNRDASESLRDVLELLGCSVDQAFSGPMGLEAARRLRPDIVLCDIGLPGMDGYEVARRLRQEAGMKDVMLVALTGYGQDEDRQRTREAGFALHLVKPVDPRELQRVLAAQPVRAA